MKATAVSRIISITCDIIKGSNIIMDICGPLFPNSVSNKWPAIMFAASRTDKVMGRIMFLIISIITMNGIRALGVPFGTKCAKASIVLFVQ